MTRHKLAWTLTALVAGSGCFVCCALLTTAIVFFGSSTFAEETVDQPIHFDHKKHVEGADLECSACHSGCKQGVASGLPAMRVCAMCHTEPQGTTPTERQVVALIRSGGKLEWRSVYQQPAHVFFSHRRHTTVAGLDCFECHSREAPRVRSPISMERCISCHEQRGVSIDCSTCHR